MNSSHFVSYLHRMWLVRHPYFRLFGSSVLCAFLSALNPLIQFPQQATPLQRGSVLMLWLRLLLRGVGHGVSTLRIHFGGLWWCRVLRR